MKNLSDAANFFRHPDVGHILLGKPVYVSVIYGEFGIIENLTAIFLLVGTVVGIRLFRRPNLLPSPWVKWRCLLIAIGCFYMAGEAISRGRHFFGWGTPEAWSALKPEQNETNLHNLYRGFNDYPRSTLAVLIALGTIAGPLYFKVRR